MSNESAPAAAMDSLLQALKVNIIPNQEYLLQGSILDTSVQRLLHRLKGLCDNVETAPEQFADYEACFSLRAPITDQLQQNQQPPLLLRVRKSNDMNDASMPFQLRYIGNPEMGDTKRPTLVRASFDISCSPSIIDFLTEMGCRLEFEYTIRGYMFRKGRMKITVSKIFKINQDPISQSYLVELSVLAPSGADAVAEDMRVFAEKLKPLVQLEKLDYKRLAQMSN
ncbi:unnamed protein product [Diamesa hyperborea]